MSTILDQHAEIKLSRESEKAFDHVHRNILWDFLTPAIILLSFISLAVLILSVTTSEFKQLDNKEIAKTLTALEEKRIANPTMTTPETVVKAEDGERIIAVIPETKSYETLITAEVAQKIHEAQKTKSR